MRTVERKPCDQLGVDFSGLVYAAGSVHHDSFNPTFSWSSGAYSEGYYQPVTAERWGATEGGDQSMQEALSVVSKLLGRRPLFGMAFETISVRHHPFENLDEFAVPPEVDGPRQLGECISHFSQIWVTIN